MCLKQPLLIVPRSNLSADVFSRLLKALKIATAALMARSNHVLSVAETEVENSEDPQFREPLETAIGELRTGTRCCGSTLLLGVSLATSSFTCYWSVLSRPFFFFSCCTAQDKTASTVASAGAGQANAAVNAHLDGATAGE